MIVRSVLVDIAVQEAQKCPIGQKYRLGSVVFKGKRVFSVGRNYNQSAAKSKLIDIKFLKWQYSIHAEQVAVIKAQRSLRGCSIVTVRLKKGLGFALAKPCKKCMEYIDFIGISNVFYSIPRYPFIEKL